VLHAEANAITKLAKSNQSSEGATIYVTDEPCADCAKLIIQSGIKRVIYARAYRQHLGLELLKKSNIEIKQIEIETNN
jgi:dCMP deaminase